jgi:hypothetical protein
MTDSLPQTTNDRSYAGIYLWSLAGIGRLLTLQDRETGVDPLPPIVTGRFRAIKSRDFAPNFRTMRRPRSMSSREGGSRCGTAKSTLHR